MNTVICQTEPMMAGLVTLGAVVRRLRKDAGLTIEQLAERAGVDKNTISRLERDFAYSSGTLEKVAKALHETRASLTALAERPEIPKKSDKSATGVAKKTSPVTEHGVHSRDIREPTESREEQHHERIRREDSASVRPPYRLESPADLFNAADWLESHCADIAHLSIALRQLARRLWPLTRGPDATDRPLPAVNDASYQGHDRRRPYGPHPAVPPSQPRGKGKR